MTWSSKYSASFTKPLIRQLMAIVQRDIASALALVYGSGDILPVFVDYQFTPRTLKQFPAIMIAPEKTQFFGEAVGTLKSETSVTIAIGVMNQDGQRLAEIVQDYVRALDAVFNSLPLSDLYTPITFNLPWRAVALTSGLEAGSVKDLWVASHNYDELYRHPTQGFQMSATLELLISREET